MTPDPEHPEDGMTEDGKPFEDWEDAFIARNREALERMVAEARASLDRGEEDTRTVDQVIAEGRARLAAER